MPAGRVNSKKKKKTEKSRRTKNTTTPKNRGRPATAANRRSLAAKQASRAGWPTLARLSIDPRFVEIGHVQLS